MSEDPISCKCNFCPAFVQFNKADAGTTATCPACGAETELFIPIRPNAPALPKKSDFQWRKKRVEDSLSFWAGMSVVSGWIGGVALILAGLLGEGVSPATVISGAALVISGMITGAVLEGMAEIIRLLRGQK